MCPSFFKILFGVNKYKISFGIFVFFFFFLRAGSSLLDVSGEPIQTLIETVGGSGAATLNEPNALTEGVEAELFLNFRSRHSIGKILFVGEDEENSVAEFIFREHLVELIAGLTDTFTIVRVNDEDDTVGVLEVVSPEGAELILTTDVPHGELDLFVLDGFDVEADGGDSGDDFTELQLEEDGGLTGSI